MERQHLHVVKLIKTFNICETIFEFRKLFCVHREIEVANTWYVHVQTEAA